MMAILSVMLLIAASCLKDMPDAFPDVLEWDPDVAFPLGEESYGLNSESGFDTTLLDLDTITGFPDWVVDELEEIVLEGTMTFGLTTIKDNLDQINNVLFRVIISNGFPNEVLAQAYFQDSAMNTIDSLFHEGPVLASPGTVQGSGETILPSHTQQDAFFDRERIQPLENAAVILFQATILISDLDTSLIPYYPSYQYDVRMGAMFDLSLEF